jgi:hypothetical protein
MRNSITFVECLGCRHYNGDGTTRWCAHPDFTTAGFLTIPIDECYQTVPLPDNSEVKVERPQEAACI